MLNWLKNVFSGVIKAGAFALARHVATLAGGALLTWLLSHHVGSDFAGRLVGDVQDMILTMTGAGLVAAGVGASIKDVRAVGAKVTVAAVAGVSQGQQLAEAKQEGAIAQHEDDQAHADAVASAISTADKASPKNKAQLLAALSGEG